MKRPLCKFAGSLLLALIAAALLPFTLPLKEGKPLLEFHTDLLKPALPEVTLSRLPGLEPESAGPVVTVYRWQDHIGRWHFSNQPPPAGILYESEEVDRNANLIVSTEGELAESEPEQESR